MKHYAWNPDKNEELKSRRGISFEEIVFHIQRGDEVDILEHPNQAKYPGQKISVVIVEQYAYLVPYIEAKKKSFSRRSSLAAKPRRYT